LSAEVLAVKNYFFGETVNCSGLLTGVDIINALKTVSFNYDALILPSVCLRSGEDVFLDGVTLQELKREINKKIIITDGSGQSFFDALTGGCQIRTV
jgi:NifB/MoaA-like Fe-S oxidoreductase